MAILDNTILRIAAHFVGVEASDVVNVYHFVMDSVGDVSEANVLADLLAYVQAIMANLTAYYGTTQELDEVKLWTRNTTNDQWDYEGSIDGTWAGSQGSTDTLPAQNAPQLNLDTENPHSHGRKYFMAPLVTAVEGGLIAGGVQAALTNAFDDIVATFVGTYAEYAVGVWSERLNNFVQFSGGGGVRAKCGTQRRRKEGVGQ